MTWACTAACQLPCLQACMTVHGVCFLLQLQELAHVQSQ